MLRVHPKLSVRWQQGRATVDMGEGTATIDLRNAGLSLNLLSQFSVPQDPAAVLARCNVVVRAAAAALIDDFKERGILIDSAGPLDQVEDIPRDLVQAKEFLSIHRRCRSFTMATPALNYALYQAIVYLNRNSIAGDVVETGVWRGGSMMLCAIALLAAGDSQRQIYLYDAFDGSWPRPEPVDQTIYGKTYAARLQNFERQEAQLASTHLDREERSESGLAQVKTNLLSTGYPEHKLTFVRGYVEDTLPRVLPDQIALLRLDTDWYRSTRHALTYLYPRLVKGGVLLVDDYPTEGGATRAVDEYFADTALFLGRIDFQGRIGIKP
jgi:hypothetical protein